MTIMGDNLGRHVKWQDVDDGWHTGRVVTLPFPGSNGEVEFSGARINYDTLTLVKESCDGKLTWVKATRLQDWQMRSEWEDIVNISGIGVNTCGGRILQEPKYDPAKRISEEDQKLVENLRQRYGPIKPLGREYAEEHEQQEVLDQIDRNYQNMSSSGNSTGD